MRHCRIDAFFDTFSSMKLAQTTTRRDVDAMPTWTRHENIIGRLQNPWPRAEILLAYRFGDRSISTCVKAKTKHKKKKKIIKKCSAKCEKLGKQKGGLLVVVLRRGAGRRGDAVRWLRLPLCMYYACNGCNATR